MTARGISRWLETISVARRERLFRAKALRELLSLRRQAQGLYRTAPTPREEALTVIRGSAAGLGPTVAASDPSNGGPTT